QRPRADGEDQGIALERAVAVARSTSTVLFELFVKTRSSLPSRLKSPAATELAATGRWVVMAGLKVPSPLPSRTLTPLQDPIGEPRATMSWCPLPRSAVTIDLAPPPTPAGMRSGIGGRKLVVSRVRSSNDSRDNRPPARRRRAGRRR